MLLNNSTFQLRTQYRKCTRKSQIRLLCMHGKTLQIIQLVMIVGTKSLRPFIKLEGYRIFGVVVTVDGQ